MLFHELNLIRTYYLTYGYYRLFYPQHSICQDVGAQFELVADWQWKEDGILHDRFRADSRFAPSQWETALLSNAVWETALLSNAVSHWLGANLESALRFLDGGSNGEGVTGFSRLAFQFMCSILSVYSDYIDNFVMYLQQISLVQIFVNDSAIF